MRQKSFPLITGLKVKQRRFLFFEIVDKDRSLCKIVFNNLSGSVFCLEALKVKNTVTDTFMCQLTLKSSRSRWV